MEDTLTGGANGKAWPPEVGLPLFVVWVAGVLVAWCLGMAMYTGFGMRGAVVDLGPLFLLRGWQSLLLFRRDLIRIIGWTSLPLLTLLPPSMVVPFLSIRLIPDFAAMFLLIGVRRYPWLWFLAAVFGNQLLRAEALGAPIWLELKASLGSTLPATPSPVVFLETFSRGLLLVEQGVCAAVLAWVMPPLIKVATRRIKQSEPGLESGAAHLKS